VGCRRSVAVAEPVSADDPGAELRSAVGVDLDEHLERP
jgi:hypothetical protein